jgi:hypothetical protein
VAVYRRNYRPYAGVLTPAWSRWLVLFRYSKRNIFRSKFVTALFVACFFWPVVCLAMIYVAHSASFLRQIGLPPGILSIDNKFFYDFMWVQGVFAFFLTAFTGPGLIFAVRFHGLNMYWANRRCWQSCYRRSPGCRD